MRGFKYFLDTNVFLRPIVRDVPSQAADCLKLLEKISKGGLVAFTSSLVLAELNWTLLKFYDYSKSDIVEILSGLAVAKNLKIADRYNPVQASQLYTTYNVKFIDCLIASHPQISSQQMAVVSYDKDFDKLGVKRFEPSDLI